MYQEMTLLFVAALVFGPPALVAWYAKGKGRSPLNWFLISLAISWIIAGIILDHIGDMDDQPAKSEVAK